jgi:DtxR family Mn-dependent transcriptional regulator
MIKPDHRRIRKRSAAVDHYLHALIELTDHAQPADTGDLAAKVGVSAAAASQMLKKLAGLDLVKVEPYKGTQLTTEGLHRALRVVRRHRLLETFLHRVMGFDLQGLHGRALALQSAIDEEFEERMDAMLERPRFDPHGRPIPARNATWPKLGDSPLLDLPPGTAGQITRVTTDSTEAIQYLHGLGVRPGAIVVLEGVSPFDGPVSVRVKGNALHLGRRLAEAIHVNEESRKKETRSMKLVASEDRKGTTGERK